MFEDFDQSARKVFTSAQKEAKELGHLHIGTEHLLLGMLKQDRTSSARKVCDECAITYSETHAAIVQRFGVSETRPIGNIPVRDDVRDMFRQAARLLADPFPLGDDYLLIGLLRNKGYQGCQILKVVNAPLELLERTAYTMRHSWLATQLPLGN